jgi:hypothetical protein
LDAVDLAKGQDRVGPGGETLRKMIRKTYHCKNVAETESTDGTALVVVVALEHVSQDQLLGSLHDVRPFLESRAEPTDVSILIFSAFCV